MKHHDNDAGVILDEVNLPEGILIIAIEHADSVSDDMELASVDSRIYPGDVVIVASYADRTTDALTALKQL